MRPLFSIIVPIFNLENYLAECLDSLVTQSYCDYEIILIDDGSSDSSLSICNDYKSKYSNVTLISQKNEGVSSARNTGLSRANGSYIIFVDGDDWIEPDLLKKYSSIIFDTNTDIVMHGLTYVRPGNVIISDIPFEKGYYEKKEIVEYIFPSLIRSEDDSYIIGSLCGKAIKRDLIEKYIYAGDKCQFGEDGASVIPCIFNCDSLYITDNCSYYYRYNPHSATNTKAAFRWDWPLLTANHITNNIDVNAFDFKEQLYRKLVHDYFIISVSQYYQYSFVKASLIINSNFKKFGINELTKKASFSGSTKALCMQFAMRYKMYLLFAFYAKFR